MKDSVLMGVLFTFGLAAGFAFQRSRLCFVSSLRDLFLFRATGMTRAILLLLLTTALGGSAVVAWRLTTGLPIQSLVGPPPITTLIGGALFGAGMVLAGSCTSGAMWRLGEGQLSQLWILLGTMGGTWAFVGGWGFPDGQSLARIPVWMAVAGLGAALSGLVLWERRMVPMGEEVAPERSGIDWRAPWSAETGAVAVAGLLLLFLAVTGRTWGVTRAFLIQDAGPIIFVVGIILGGLLGAYWGREFRIRPLGGWPSRLIRLVGGFAMGFGARMAWGCTLGVLHGGTALQSPQPWYWMAGAIPGAWVGALILRRFMARWL